MRSRPSRRIPLRKRCCAPCSAPRRSSAPRSMSLAAKRRQRRSVRLKPAASPCAKQSCASACRISPCAWCRSASARRTRSPRSSPSAAAHPCAMRSSSFSAARGAYPAARSATTPARQCKRCAASKRPVLSNSPSARCCASAAMMMRPRARTLCSTANSRPLSTVFARS